MPAIELAVFRFAASLARKAFADVPEADMRLQILPTMNPPVWILGHLTAVFGFTCKELGADLGCPPAYITWFGPGSKPEALPAALPTKSELLNLLAQCTETILSRVPMLSEDDLAKPNPTPFFHAELPTLRAILENLLVAHTMLHVGQMTVWRKARLLPSIIVLPSA